VTLTHDTHDTHRTHGHTTHTTPQEHRNHKDLGELQLPEELECPVGCGQHIGERWRMDHHFNTECEGKPHDTHDTHDTWLTLQTPS
jgi:hypothetical protein